MFSGNYVNAEQEDAGDNTYINFSVDGISVGSFCKVEKVDICVITRNEKDCIKLNGKKVDVCPESEKEKVK